MSGPGQDRSAGGRPQPESGTLSPRLTGKGGSAGRPRPGRESRVPLTLALLALLLLAACGARIRAGYVLAKDYRPPSSWTSMECVARNVKTGGCLIQMPVTHAEPPHWRLRLKDDQGHEGWTDVDQPTWNRVEVGAHYPDAR